MNVILDTEGYVMHVDPFWESVSGYPQARFLGNHWSGVQEFLLDPREKNKADEYLSQVLKKGFFSSEELRFKKISGQPCHMTLHMFLLKNKREFPNSILVRAQESSIGYDFSVPVHTKKDHPLLPCDISSRLSHELKNPLSGIFLNAQMMEEEIPDESPLRSYIQDILTATQRIESTLNEHFAFVHVSEPRFQAFLFPFILDRAIAHFQGRAEEHSIRLHTHYEPDLPMAFGDPVQIFDSLIHVLENAIQSELQGGEIVLSCRKTVHPGPNEELSPWIEVQIRDSGCGISPAILSRVFDPFFTTKSGRRGVGLSLVLAIAKENRAKIFLESPEGKGTRFRMQIPCAHPLPEK